MTVPAFQPVRAPAESAGTADPRIGVAGVGAVGTALVASLRSAKLDVASLWSRGAISSDIAGGAAIAASAQHLADSSDLIFLTVPDASIAGLASGVRWRPGQTVVHCSGALGLDVLEAPARDGATAVALHPLYSFPKNRPIAFAPGTAFAFTGPDRVRTFFAGLVVRLGGVLIDLPEERRAVYHAAAIMACNYLVTLAGAATALLQSIGMEKQSALAALLPLMQGTCDNLAAVGLPDALTGPVVRADIDTVERHRAALQGGEFAALYDLLADATGKLALGRADLSAAQRSAIERFLAKRADERVNPNST